MSNKKIINSYDFEIDNKLPKNIFRCHFFKTAYDDIPRNIDLNMAYCSIKDVDLLDYKICCTKHDGEKLAQYCNCQSFLEKMGNMYDKDRLELRSLKLMKESVEAAGKSSRTARNATFISLIMLIVAGFGLWLAYVGPQQEKDNKMQEQIKYIYRNINANEDIFISNINGLRYLKEDTKIDDLPFNYLELNLSSDMHDELQRKIGLVNYRFLLYYSENTNSLNSIINKIKDGFYSNKLNKKDKTIYFDLMEELSKEDWKDTKFNYQMDTGCLLKILRESFPYIIDNRNSQVECNNDSLSRIYHYFGYLEVETPAWMKPKFKEALKEQNIDAWWIN